VTDKRPLTDKEQKAIDAFEQAQPGYGKLAERNIRNQNSGWAESIVDMDESQIEVEIRTAETNPHGMYRRNF
jgi:hypothetical protein